MAVAQPGDCPDRFGDVRCLLTENVRSVTGEVPGSYDDFPLDSKGDSIETVNVKCLKVIFCTYRVVM